MNLLRVVHGVRERPPDAVGVMLAIRAGVLFAALGGIKLGMLYLQRDELFQAHWWAGNILHGPRELLTLGVVLLLANAAGWLLAQAGPRLTPAGVRRANGWLVLLGLLFVFLNFSQVGQNYLVPVMDGVLRWRDIGTYLAMELFFRPPYLSVWLAGYALVWWLWARTGRERWMPLVTTVVGSLYTLVNLRFVAGRLQETSIVAAVGVICVLVWWRAPGRARAWWAAVPVILGVAAYVLIHDLHQAARHPHPFLLMVLAWLVVLFAGAQWFARRHGFAPEWNHCAPFLVSGLLLLALYQFPYWINVTHTFAVGIALPVFLWREALVVLLFWLGLRLLVRRWPRAAWWIGDAAALGLIAVALGDLQVLRVMGVRLDWNIVAMSDSLTMTWRMVRPFLAAGAGWMLAGVGLYAALIFLLRDSSLGRRLAGQSPASGGGRFVALTALIVLAAVGEWRLATDPVRGLALARLAFTSPAAEWFRRTRLSEAEFRRLGDKLKVLPRPSPAVTATNAGPLNVFLIVMESSYNKYLSLFGAADETQPLLRKYRDRMELFPNFYSNFPSSIHARTTILTGLYGTPENPTYVNPHLPIPSLYEVLHDHGHTTLLFDSCFTEYLRFRDFLVGRNIDVLRDSNNMPGRENFPPVTWGLQEECTMMAVTNEFARLAGEARPFFLTYLPVAPHYPFDSPSERFSKFDSLIGLNQRDYSNRYKNQLLYLDWVITTMLDALDAQGLLDQTLVLITNDHGEMVGDNGLLGHGSNLEPELANTPLIIMDPRRPRGERINPVLGSQVDILPTTLALLGIPLPAGELYQGVPLHDEAANAGRYVYLLSYKHRAVVTGDLYVLEDPPTPEPGHPPQWGKVHRINFEGARTRFTPTGERITATERLDDFHRFQNALYRNYGHYRELLRNSSP